MEAVIEHNHELCTVGAGTEQLPKCLRMDGIEERFLTQEQKVQLRDGKNMLALLLWRVRKYVPSLDLHSLNRWVDAVEWIDMA